MLSDRISYASPILKYRSLVGFGGENADNVVSHDKITMGQI